jgi:hypothetical protein
MAEPMKPAMAWAVVHEDGKIASLSLFGKRDEARGDASLYDEARLARVRITEVEAKDA